VEAGFDVWVGNNRGNIYSRGHLSKTAEGDFFDYSFWELGKYDLPAMIDRIRKETKLDKIAYIGHS
jgi:lysosomal acid lipase/cholesteryl ester hydrolase